MRILAASGLVEFVRAIWHVGYFLAVASICESGPAPGPGCPFAFSIYAFFGSRARPTFMDRRALSSIAGPMTRANWASLSFLSESESSN